MASTPAMFEQNAALMTRPETAADVLAAQAKAIVQARYLVAYSHPRDKDQVRQKLLKDCERPSFAETAIYRKPVGKSSVEGLSVRFAEAAQRALTNIEPSRVIVYDDASKRIVRISMTDLESNVSHSKDLILEKTIERRDSKGRNILGQRLNSYGDTVYIVEATEDELLIKESAISSKIERQLTLKLLDGDIQDECIRRIRETQNAADKADPDAAKKRVVDAFDDLGIRVPDLKKFLGLELLDSMQPSDLKQLREVYTAIKEGETNWREVMEQRESARGNKDDEKESSPKSEKLVDLIRNRGKNADAKQSKPSEAEQKPASESKSETQTSGVTGFDFEFQKENV